MKRLSFAVLLILVSRVGFAGNQSPERWKLGRSPKRILGPEWIERFQKMPWMRRIDWGLTKEEVTGILAANLHQRFWTVDDTGVINTYSITDLRWERAARQWQVNGSLAYLILDPIGSYTDDSPGGGNVADDVGRQHLEHEATKIATQRLIGPKGVQCSVFISIGVPQARASLHELLRPHIRGTPRLTGDHGSAVLESEDYLGEGHYATWSSEPDIMIYIHSQDYSSEILDAYARKYPSRLADDLKFDVVQWGRRELDLKISEMRERLELPDENLTYRSGPTFETSLGRLAVKFGVTDLAEEHLRERKRMRVELIAGDEWRQDYDGYKRELIARRVKILSTVEDLARRAKTNMRFSKSRRVFVVGGEPAASEEPTEGVSPAADTGSDGATAGDWILPALVVLGMAVVGVAAALRRRSRKRSLPAE